MDNPNRPQKVRSIFETSSESERITPEIRKNILRNIEEKAPSVMYDIISFRNPNSVGRRKHKYIRILRQADASSFRNHFYKFILISVPTERRNGGVPDLTRFSSKAMKIFGRSHAWVGEITGDQREIVCPKPTATVPYKVKNKEPLFKIQIVDNYSFKYVLILKP
ncbi:MAG: hypothetical protein Q4D65_05855 [Peptostreptococcaceae bacterium]|nr:hypothetical protein [Peptostreptococcaceae bacterium]